MSPPDFSKEPPIIVEKNNTVNRENLVNTTVTNGTYMYEYESTVRVYNLYNIKKKNEIFFLNKKLLKKC